MSHPKMVAPLVQKELKMICDMFKGTKQAEFYDWLFGQGSAFTGRKLTNEEEEHLVKILRRKLYKLKHCFHACQIVSLFSPSYQYYEGYARNPAVPMNIEHAWLVKDGKVLDPTWPDGTEYFGIPIPLDVIRTNIMKTGMAQSMLITYYRQEVAK